MFFTNMKIQFKKGKDKPSTLTCARDDGSNTWTKIHDNFEAHDLAHYAVETILGFDNAFYGLLAQGFNIEDFELPKNQRPNALIPSNLPVEALQTEHMVNLLMTEAHENSSFDFIATLQQILDNDGIPFPEGLTPKSLDDIKNCFQKLMNDWNALKAGGTLDLTFGE